MKRLVAALAAASSLSACGMPPHCVGRGTWVTTAGKKRLVEELVAGDEIISVEPTTGAHRVGKITAITTAEKECGVLRLPDGTTLTMTEEHPVYDPTDAAFHPAIEWFSGARSALLCFEDGKTVVARVAERTPFFDIRTVYDLTVESAWHTFVADGVVVHNKSPLLSMLRAT